MLADTNTLSHATLARTPRVAILTTADSIGGMERVACGLARGLTAHGWGVRTVFPQSPKSATLLRWCAEQGVGAEAHPAVLNAAAPHSWDDVRKLRSFLLALRPDVVSLHYGDNFISLKDVLAARLAGVRRCVVSVYHPTEWTSENRRKQLMTGLAARFCDAITTCSHASAATLRAAGIPSSKLHLIPCGLRVPVRLPTRNEARVRLGLPADALIIGSLARLVPHKAIGDLVAAVARLVPERPHLLLAIAGDGPERPALEQRAAIEMPGRAVFLGRVPDIDDFLAACDIFALPSQLEGFGLVYVEAAFHGVPSIGTVAGGIPDAVIDGETGLLMSVGDIDALADALRRLCDNPALRRKLGEAARNRACTEFTEDMMAARFARVLWPGEKQL